MAVFYIWWSNFALNICILIKGKQFCLFLFTFGFSLRIYVSNHFKEFHEKNKTATLGEERWWQRGQEDFWEVPYMLVSSTGLELPWVQGLLPVVPPWICFKRGSSRLGVLWGKLGSELGFTERFATKIVVRVCACTPRRTRGLCPLLLGLGRKASNYCGPCRQCPDRFLGREVPPKSWQLACWGSP